MPNTNFNPEYSIFFLLFILVNTFCIQIMDLIFVSTQHFCQVSFRCSAVLPRSKKHSWLSLMEAVCCSAGQSRLKLAWFSFCNGKSHKIFLLLWWLPILLAHREVVILALLSGWVGGGRHPVIKAGMCSSTWQNSVLLTIFSFSCNRFVSCAPRIVSCKRGHTPS